MNDELQLIGPFTQCLPMTGLPLKGALNDDQLPLISNAGILVADGKIKRIADFGELSAFAKAKKITIIEIEGEHVCLPGFVDAHTHICFAGSRAQDYALRNAGKTYLEIAAQGGGIWDSVTQARAATERGLVENIIKRAAIATQQGITTLEVKSGYGLDIPNELKMLRAIKKANSKSQLRLVATCLAAHMKPRDFEGSPAEYLDLIASELFPLLKKENLANRIDAFVEESAFSPSEIAPYFEKAKAMGFDLTVHADQFSTGGSAVAVKYGAVSADHLEVSGQREIELLAKSDTIATALPGATLGLGCSFTPARKLLDAGAALAIASDWNPGSAPMGNLLMQASVLGTFEKLTNAEVLAGITFRAAAALNRPKSGKLATGNPADFILFPTSDYREITYHQGQLLPDQVFVGGTTLPTTP